MRQAQLPEAVIDTFAHYYGQLLAGECGLVFDRDIRPVAAETLPSAASCAPHAAAGRAACSRAVRIVLNGGLGTSMGLTGAKSLLPVKEGRSFLEIILSQAEAQGQRLALMNSFSTRAETQAALERLRPPRMPLCFLQHKYPKVLRQDLAPASWPPDPSLEWNPPGHGDVYTALATSGMLARLLDDGIRYAFISNSDNLGARMDPALLGFFIASGASFMMEVARKTPADIKGGHLARHVQGRLLLRESAQCPAEEIGAFEDIARYQFFNTNNIWIDLHYLKDLLAASGIVRLPMIVNPKTLDPRDPLSPLVFQIESAMGAAISLFEGAIALQVPRERFFPVKKCGDLLAVRSDLFGFGAEEALEVRPVGRAALPSIWLDPRHYGRIDDFEARFPHGPPSLIGCEGLRVEGDVRFAAGVAIRGRVRIRNRGATAAWIPAGARVEGDLDL
jgi:UTP--glucose-1-phosphate uridylyltransferase